MKTAFITVMMFLGALIVGCAPQPPRPPITITPPPAKTPSSLVTTEETAPLQMARWTDLTGWQQDKINEAWPAWLLSCQRLATKPLWASVCLDAQKVAANDSNAQRLFLETRLRPWRLVKEDGSNQGLITGYYEPIINGSRQRSARYTQPVFAPPTDLIVVDLGEIYPQLKSLRLRGRLQGNKLIPYFNRAQWATEQKKRHGQAILWVDNAIDLFFMEIQGSGQVEMDDGTRIRLSYAEQNGHPYKSIGRWLIDQNELASGQASMQNIKAWAAKNPQRVNALLNVNPSLIFFRELPATGSGPPGALGVPLTPERSIAVDPQHITLGAPVWLSTTWPNDTTRPLQRLVLAQDTGGAIRGGVRADYFWGSGTAAGVEAGKMSQAGQMWVLMPAEFQPKAN